jgi:predicted nucleic acid-binding protein
MRLVLDANEYVYAFGVGRKPSCETLLLTLSEQGGHDVRVLRTIVEEVVRNTRGEAHSLFFEALDDLLEEGYGIDETFIIPYHIGFQYRERGFKPADALIAAYADVVGADMVISENRKHFHGMADRLPFQVMDAEQFLRRYGSRRIQ